MTVAEPRTIVLADGRTLAFDDVGAPDGEVVVYFHGAPDCRLSRHPDDGIAARLGVRLIALDRPGYGRSSPPLVEGFAGTAGDTAELLDALGVATCRVLGWSAGGARALVAAGALRERCTGAVVYAAVAPLEAGLDESALAGAPRRATIVTAALEGEMTAAEIAEEIVPMMLPVVPVPAELSLDLVRDALGNRARAELDGVPGMLEQLAAASVEAASVHGAAGVRADLLAELTPGQADVVLAATCPVRLVYGGRDAISGPPIGEWYRTHLAHATLEVWPEGTHHSLFPSWERLLREG